MDRHDNRTKKNRMGLPMELEMALPFLSVTTDLPRFAAVSKACSAAALASYQLRTKETSPATTYTRSRTPLATSSNICDRESLEGFQMPWWAVKENKAAAWFHENCHLTVHQDGSWTLPQDLLQVYEDDETHNPPEWLYQHKFSVPKSHCEKFMDDTEVVHASLVERIALVILCCWTDRGEELYNTEDTRKQLFVLLYQLPIATTKASVLPILCEAITKPLDRNNYGSIDDIYFGNSIRSRNGRVAAVVTALPLGCDDNEDDEEPRETAEISVFHILEGGKIFRKMHTIQMPMGDRTHESNLSMTLSNGGDLISIETTHDFDVGVSWSVYSLAPDAEPDEIVRAEELGNYYSNRFWGHQFSPDNELWISLPNEITPSTHFRDVQIPHWLSKRMIVVQNDKRNEDDPLLLSP